MWICTHDGLLLNSEHIASIRLEGDGKKSSKMLAEMGKVNITLATGTDNELATLLDRVKVALVHSSPYVNLGDD